MRKLLIICSFFLCGKAFSFTGHLTYYISLLGDNTTGLTPAHAWTFAKLGSSMGTIIEGDSILFHRGETFYGNLVFVNSGTMVNYIYFGDYGVGVKPIITGLSTVTGWVNLGGNIWEAPLTVRPDINLVLRDGIVKQVGRFPNFTYFTYTASTPTTITGSALSTTTNWVGAEVAVRLFSWEIRKRRVDVHSGGIVGFQTMTDVPTINYGYFFQRDSRTVDIDGEWYQNGTTNKLRMYFGNNNPGVYTIQVATKDTLIKSTKSNLVFNNLYFYGCNKAALMQVGGSNITIKNCDVNTTGEDGITAWFSTNVTVDSCSVYNSLGSGIRIRSASSGIVNIVVKNSTVNKSSFIAGMEPNSGNIGDGIQVYGGDNVTLTNCIIKNSGYNGIGWNGSNVLIKNNFVDSFCLVRDDGGGIYSYDHFGSTIVEGVNRRHVSNIIDNGIGYAPGTSRTYPSANGDYTDEGTRGVTMDSNTIVHISYNAFQGNNNANLIIRNNTVFQSYVAFAYQRLSNGPGPLMRGFHVAKNIFYPYRFRYRNLANNLPSVLTKEQDIPLMFDVLDSNYYSLRSGIDTSLWATTQYSDKTHTLFTANNFSYLTGTIGVETHSINVPNTGIIEYNASNYPRVVAFPGVSKIDVFGTVYNNSVTIQPWRSVILIPNGSTGSNIPPIANAGTDSTITLPINTVHVLGSATDADGTIVSHLWSKKSGPGGGVITANVNYNTTITSLVQGVYEYQLIVTDNSGASDTDIVIITVNSAVIPPNAPPSILYISPNKNITLPINSVIDTVRGIDSDGTIVAWRWWQSLGPSTATITPNNDSITTFSNLIVGTYIFKGVVEDDDGDTTFANTRVVVSDVAPDIPPTANAGPDRDITLPIDFATLDGTLSSGNSGAIIVSYSWKEGVTTVGTGSTVNLTALTQGLHTYILTVTDDNGLTATDTVTVLVRPVVTPDIGTVLLGWILP